MPATASSRMNSTVLTIPRCGRQGPPPPDCLLARFTMRGILKTASGKEQYTAALNCSKERSQSKLLKFNTHSAGLTHVLHSAEEPGRCLQGKPGRVFTASVHSSWTPRPENSGKTVSASD